jgi:hypothetical protein
MGNETQITADRHDVEGVREPRMADSVKQSQFHPRHQGGPVASLVAMTGTEEEQILRNKANSLAGLACSVPVRPLKETPYGVTTNKGRCVKQSQLSGQGTGRREQVRENQMAHFAKQSQFQGPTHQEQGAVMRNKANLLLGQRWAQPTLQEGLRRYCVKQSQFALTRQETPCGVTTDNGWCETKPTIETGNRQETGGREPHGRFYETKPICLDNLAREREAYLRETKPISGRAGV